MKTKIIAVIVVLSISFCANSYGQMAGKGGNASTPTQPVDNGVNNNGSATPTPAASPSVISATTINGVINEVRKTSEYKAIEKRVKAKVNATKVGKGASKFRLFLQRIGLAKKPATPVRKVGVPVK
ncbi:MAG: hypothetical protein M0D57_07005 [Sphingobacteriales bacterium JAD_PAG50586_3]|nr:MAG: hypothetical protein M0D57_07005 [Sphingobacteriales bacterium JAD_PAG50586_3]